MSIVVRLHCFFVDNEDPNHMFAVQRVGIDNCLNLPSVILNEGESMQSGCIRCAKDVLKLEVVSVAEELTNLSRAGYHDIFAYARVQGQYDSSERCIGGERLQLHKVKVTSAATSPRLFDVNDNVMTCAFHVLKGAAEYSIMDCKAVALEGCDDGRYFWHVAVQPKGAVSPKTVAHGITYSYGLCCSKFSENSYKVYAAMEEGRNSEDK